MAAPARNDLERRLSGGEFETDSKQSLGGVMSDTSLQKPISALWDYVDYNESFFGDTEYRCIYWRNNNDSLSMLALKWYVVQGTLPDGSTSPIEHNIAVDPHGVGDGRNTGIAYTIADEGTAPVIGVPDGVSASATDGGSLTSGTYYYVVTALNNNGETVASAEVSADVDGSSTTAVEVSWNSVPGATKYRVYGRASGAQDTYWETTSTTFTDTAGAGTSGTPPGSNTAELEFPGTPPSDANSAIGQVNLAPGEAVALWIKRTVPVGTQQSWDDEPLIEFIFGG